jgi:hyperosmotically inducible protein
MKKIFLQSLCGFLALATGGGLGAQERRPPSEKGEMRLQKEVRHELVMLPTYDVFDNLAYKVEGGTVTLFGQVTRPTLKSDAERAVKGIEGVEQVDNRIEVLPASPNDDQIRRAVYRAVYGTAGLDRYAMRAVPTIHIIVKDGHVFLEGAVANEGDKNLANIKASGVSGVFSVTNNLQVDRA